jgi:CheY-like chemotaxis protein
MTNPGLILVVEDDGAERKTMCNLLEENGYHAVPMENGKAALDYLVSQRDEPCLILLDDQLPVMTGWEFLAVIKSYTRLARIPVVLVATDPPHPDVAASGAIAAYVPKPATAETLLPVVRDCAHSK